MNPSATRHDFQKLPKDLQDRYLDVLDVCVDNSMSCRCEMVGNDFTMIIGRGYSSAKYWITTFTDKRETTA